MKPLIHLGLIALTAVHVAAETLIIPQGAETREEVYQSAFPFSGPGDTSSQQVYSSGLFPTLSEPGQLFQIDRMAFRLASGGNFPLSASATFDRVEIIVSSATGPFTLDLTANHGANQQIVFDGPLTLSGNVPGGTTPSLFDLQIEFESPFLYDNSTGALVVEIRKYGSGELPALAAAMIPGTTFFFNSADGTETLGNIGLETRFNYQVVPEPNVSTLVVLGLLTLMRGKKRIL